jgi:hypothetical protein
MIWKFNEIKQWGMKLQKKKKKIKNRREHKELQR